MKNTLTFIAVLIAALSFSQVKVWSGGIGLGYTGSAPTTGYKLQVSGNSLFSSATGTTLPALQ